MPKLREIIGHQGILDELRLDIETGNIVHAYLFAGPRHLGKMTVAQWFSYQLLCSGKPENEIDDCQRQFEKLTHPDLLVLDQLWMEDTADDWDFIAQTSNVSQQHRAKAKAKTDTISIDDVRAFQERLHEISLGRWRCCIIRSVERMQAEAANAFLKILEEPPPGLVFILTTQSLQSLLPTMISRSRVLHFRQLPHEELEPLLKGSDEDDHRLILRVAQGAPGIVQLFTQDPEQLRLHKAMYAHARSFWQAQTLAQRLALLKPLEKRGEESDQLLLHLSLALRDQQAEWGAVRALNTLITDLQTNAYRTLLAQRFAVSLEAA